MQYEPSIIDAFPLLGMSAKGVVLCTIMDNVIVMLLRFMLAQAGSTCT